MSWKKGRKLGPRSTAMFTYRQIKNAAWGFVSCSATKGFFSTRRALGSVPVLKKQQRRQQHQQNYMECKASVPHRDLLRGATSMSQELGGGSADVWAASLLGPCTAAIPGDQAAGITWASGPTSRLHSANCSSVRPFWVMPYPGNTVPSTYWELTDFLG